MFRTDHTTATITIFFFNDTATTEIYTLSLHDALPIYVKMACSREASSSWNSLMAPRQLPIFLHLLQVPLPDRKSTRLNSSHSQISYAVFCLKKKNYIHRSINTTATTVVFSSLRMRTSY